jgi:hypothetical protein
VGTGQVGRWVTVAPSWMGHRAEPLLHERMWACPLELAGNRRAHDGRLHQAGFDVAGRPVILRRSEPDSGLDPHHEIETVEYREGEILLHLPGGTVATTTIDGHGRPLRTVYDGAEAGEEAYHYDAAGRLAAIDEAECLWRTVSFYEMWDATGGRLAVEHDDDGPRRIVDSAGKIRWERCGEPWDELLERGARAICDGVVRVVGDHCRAHAVEPTTEVSALVLTCVAQGSLDVTLSFGPEADRRLNHIDGTVIDEPLDSLLLREAAMKQPNDPYRVVLDAAAAHLAHHDWGRLLTTTDDFIVHIAVHDED